MLLSHGCSSRGISCLLFTRIVLVPNYRIGLFSHGESRSSRMSITNILFLSRIIEFLFTRRVTVLLSRDLSFGPTDQREVICELSNWFIFTRRLTESHGLFTRVFFLSRIIEFANWFRHAEGHGISRMVFVPRLVLGPTDQREVICELVFFTRNVTDGHGGYEGGTIEA